MVADGRAPATPTNTCRRPGLFLFFHRNTHKPVVGMATRLYPTTTHFSNGVNHDRNPSPLLHLRRGVLPIHVQPRYDAPSTVLEEPSKIGDPMQSTLLPCDDALDAPIVPNRSHGVLETLRWS